MPDTLVSQKFKRIVEIGERVSEVAMLAVVGWLAVWITVKNYFLSGFWCEIGYSNRMHAWEGPPPASCLGPQHVPQGGGRQQPRRVATS